MYVKFNTVTQSVGGTAMGAAGEKGTRLESVTITVAVNIECFCVRR